MRMANNQQQINTNRSIESQVSSFCVATWWCFGLSALGARRSCTRWLLGIFKLNRDVRRFGYADDQPAIHVSASVQCTLLVPEMAVTSEADA
jgi:hypothetical protein